MKKVLSLLFCTLFLLLTPAFGAYFEKVPITLVQPDGTKLNLFVTGDEFFRRVHDEAGYTMLQREDGWIVYAEYNSKKDELVASNYIVGKCNISQLPIAKELMVSLKKNIEKRKKYFENTNCNISGAALKPFFNDSIKSKLKKGPRQMNNIVICIGFDDTPAMTNSFPFVDGLLNSNIGNNMKDFFLTMSYGKLNIQSHFYPQPDENMLRFYKDPKPREYYKPYNRTSNPNGYVSDDEARYREHTLLRDAINWVNINNPIPESLNLDINNDGKCDFITFIIQGEPDGWSNLLWPHKWELSTYNVRINGKQVYSYNFELDGSTTYFNVGTFCHEGYHVLGAPDLYHYKDQKSAKAVGVYDLMDNTNSKKPQSMSAFMKYKYGEWISNMVTAEWDKTYEVYPFYTNDGSNSEKPVIINIPSGLNNQFYVVEYRKKEGNNYDNQIIPDFVEGPLIYRIDKRYDGNAEYNPTSRVFDEVYLFREGSIPDGNTYLNGNFSKAPFIEGRTTFNSSSTPYAFNSDNTLNKSVNIKDIVYDAVSDSYVFFYGTGKKYFDIANKQPIQLPASKRSSANVDITSNVKWSVSIEPEDAATWLDVSKKSGLNDGSYTIKPLTGNYTNSDRTAVISFSANGNSIPITVTQIHGYPNFEFSSPVAAFCNLEGSYDTVRLFSDEPWTSTIDDNTWFRIEPSTGSGDTLLKVIALTDNTTGVDKVGRVTISNGIIDPIVLEVIQKPSCYTVNTTTNPIEAGITKGGGTFVENRTVTVTTTTNPKYIFLSWKKEGIEVSKDTFYTFKVTENQNLVANFYEIPEYTINILPQDHGEIEVYSRKIQLNSGDKVEEGTLLMILPKPNQGYYIGKIIVKDDKNNDVALNEKNIFEIKSDVTISVDFTIGIENYKFHNLKVYSKQNIVYIDNKDNVLISTLEIIDMFGRVVYKTKKQSKSTILNLDIPSGIYIVRLVIGKQVVSRKVHILR